MNLNRGDIMKKDRISIIDRIQDYFYIRRRNRATCIKIVPFNCIRKNNSHYLAFNLDKNKALNDFYKRNPKIKCIYYKDEKDNVYNQSSLIVCKTKENFHPIQEGSVLFIPVKIYIGDVETILSLEEKEKLIKEIVTVLFIFKNFIDSSFVKEYGEFSIPLIDWYDIDYEDKFEYRKVKRKKLKI